MSVCAYSNGRKCVHAQSCEQGRETVHVSVCGRIYLACMLQLFTITPGQNHFLPGVTRLYAPLGQPYFSCAEIPCCPPQTYITIAQAPVTLDQFNGDLSPGPVLLGPGKGQHVSTPIYPPSYFGPSSACYTSLSDVNPSLAAPLKP